VTRRGILLAFVLGCGASEPPARGDPGATERAATSETVTTGESGAPGAAERCLPVVAPECGCVYDCGLGTRDGDAWSVVHSNWGETALRAVVDEWCVGDECTDAFHAEIVCDGICERRAASADCVLDASGCHD